MNYILCTYALQFYLSNLNVPFLDENLDLENFGKKKKKKKKTFNLEELDGALPENATNKSKEDGIEEMDEENAIEVLYHLSCSKLLILNCSNT